MISYISNIRNTEKNQGNANVSAFSATVSFITGYQSTVKTSFTVLTPCPAVSYPHRGLLSGTRFSWVTFLCEVYK